jgi:hypothetical protein
LYSIKWELPEKEDKVIFGAEKKRYVMEVDGGRSLFGHHRFDSTYGNELFIKDLTA